MIEAIIFDVDGVLVDSRNANVAFFQALLAKAGYRDTRREEVLACFHLPLWQSLEKLTGADKQEVRRIFEMANDPSLRDGRLLVFPEKIENLLEELHKKYKLAIATSRIKLALSIFLRPGKSDIYLMWWLPLKIMQIRSLIPSRCRQLCADSN